MHPILNTGITLTQYSPWVWHVSRDGKRLGTVSGDRVVGYIARDIQHHSIGRYSSAEAAMEAWGPNDGYPALTLPVSEIS